MKKILVTSAIALVVSLGQILGQSTTTTSTQTQNSEGIRNLSTSTETRTPGGRTITTTTSTSTANAKVSFGIKANANMSNFFLKDMDGFQSNMGIGFSTGVFLKIESYHFALQYELLLHYKTSELKGITQADYKQWVLELPIYFMGQINTGSGKIFIGGGPYAGFGLDAIQNPGMIDLYKKDPTTDKSIMQRWDVGLGVIWGYEFRNGISLNSVSQIGFINRLSAEKDAISMKNQTLSVGIGYKF